MIQKLFFRVFQLFAMRSNISIRKTLERNRKSYSFSENDYKHETTLAKNLHQNESKLATPVQTIFIILKKLRLIVTGSCNSSRPQRFMVEKFSKMKSVKHFPESPWPVKDWVTLVYFQLKGARWKKKSDDFDNKQTLALRQASEESACFLLSFFCDD